MSRDSAIDRIIETTAMTEGRGRYDAWNPNDRGAGVSYGLIQFNQRSGSLSDVFQAMYARNPSLFVTVFGSDTDNFLNASWVRNAELNSSPYFEEMINAAAYPDFQQAQRDVARSIYFTQAENLAEQYGLISERAYAMLFDAFVQRSPPSVKTALENAKLGAGPDAAEEDVLAYFAILADDLPGGQVTTRRQDLLASSYLSDEPFGSASADNNALLTSATAGVNIVRLAGVGVVAYLLWRRFH